MKIKNMVWQTARNLEVNIYGVVREGGPEGDIPAETLMMRRSQPRDDLGKGAEGTASSKALSRYEPDALEIQKGQCSNIPVRGGQTT